MFEDDVDDQSSQLEYPETPLSNMIISRNWLIK